ncbi:MAG: hypothetical protein QOE50_1157 [Sphingomonadales bacterium]|nr:hypothetical protein [Sphingomonadales bacterium]
MQAPARAHTVPLVIDAQAHVWESSRPDRPWAVGLKPHLPEPLSGEMLLDQMNRVGVDRAILIPAMLLRFSNDYALEMAAAYPTRFGVMGRFDFTAPDAPKQLAHWFDQPGMLGMRLVLKEGAEGGSVADPTVAWVWPAAEAAGIPIMLRVLEEFDELGRLAARHPRLTLIVDHLGLKSQPGPGVFDVFDNVVRLADHANVLVKASSLPLYSNAPYPFADLDVHLQRIFDAFGADRVMWGSDLTRVAKHSGYADVVGHFLDGCAFLSDDDRANVMGLTAARALHWPA